jgi:hypothetical protein
MLVAVIPRVGSGAFPLHFRFEALMAGPVQVAAWVAVERETATPAADPLGAVVAVVVAVVLAVLELFLLLPHAEASNARMTSALAGRVQDLTSDSPLIVTSPLLAAKQAKPHPPYQLLRPLYIRYRRGVHALRDV